MPKKFFILLFAVFLLPTLIYAQAGQTGAINGVVRTPEGDPLPGVTVILESPALFIPSLDSVTNENGRYCFLSLSPGVYELTYARPGVKKIIRKGIQVSAGITVTVDIDMTLKTKNKFIVPVFTLGGPIIKDRLWFLTNLSLWRIFYFVNGYAADYPENPIPIKEFKPYPHIKFPFIQPYISIKNYFALSFYFQPYKPFLYNP